MKFSTFTLPILAAMGLPVVTAGNVETPNSYVKVEFADKTVRYFDFGECYPFKINGVDAERAVWLKSTTCFAHETLNCTGAALAAVGVPVPKGTILINVERFALLVGQSAMCYENGVPNLPIPRV